ncbi:MAG: hypothetical protein PUC53_01840 [Bacteroidales bacterium]|nr:hypothetical protein [Bacteroidales bacterium]
MNTPDSQAVVQRFFQALYYLKAENIIRGKQTFTSKYGINRWNLNSLEKDPSSNIFQVAWLGYLVKDFGVSSRWLLTGQGNILAKGK